MTYIVSGGALNYTHSLTPTQVTTNDVKTGFGTFLYTV